MLSAGINRRLQKRTLKFMTTAIIKGKTNIRDHCKIFDDRANPRLLILVSHVIYHKYLRSSRIITNFQPGVLFTVVDC